MFSAIPSDISTAIEAQWAARLKLCAALNAKALDTVSQLNELNLSLLQQTLAHVAPGEKPATTTDPLAYGRQFSRIVFDAGVEYLRLLQPGIEVTEQQISKQIDNLVDNTPAPSTGILDLLRNALGQANSGYHKLIKASEDAVQALGEAAKSASEPAAPEPAARKSARKPAAAKDGAPALKSVKRAASAG